MRDVYPATCMQAHNQMYLPSPIRNPGAPVLRGSQLGESTQKVIGKRIRGTKGPHGRYTPSHTHVSTQSDIPHLPDNRDIPSHMHTSTQSDIPHLLHNRDIPSHMHASIQSDIPHLPDNREIPSHMHASMQSDISHPFTTDKYWVESKSNFWN
jgi:hypothetical protein